IVDVSENARATVVIGLTRLGHADVTRGAIEQANAEALLDRLDVQGDGARRHVERPTGGGKAATVDHLHIGRHAEHAVHGVPQMSSECPVILAGQSSSINTGSGSNSLGLAGDMTARPCPNDY